MKRFCTTKIDYSKKICKFGELAGKWAKMSIPPKFLSKILIS